MNWEAKISREQLDAISNLFTPSGMFVDVAALKGQLDRENEALESVERTRKRVMNMINTFEDAKAVTESSGIIHFPELTDNLEEALEELAEKQLHLLDKEVSQLTKRNEVRDRFLAVCNDNDNTFDRIKGILNIMEDK